MYRAESKPLTCPVCAGTHVSPETLLDPTEGNLVLHFEKADVAPTFFGEDRRLRTTITRCRVCLACGYVMPFITAGRLATLHKESARLQALAPTEPEPS